MKKRVFAVFLALAMCLALLPTAAVAAAEPTGGKCGDNLTWALENGVLTILGTGAMEDFGYDEAPWYEIRSKITTVVIGQGVTSIGEYAFCKCANMICVTIPNSVTSIGRDAFRECVQLAGITIPDGVSKIADGAFYGCTGLSAVTLPAGLTEIPLLTFSYCVSLTDVNIPSGVTKIGREAFYKCTGLIELAIPDGVTEIDRYAFLNCTRLSRLTLPGSAVKFHLNAVKGCTGLTRIDVAEDNPSFASENGVLFDKAKTTLLCCPEGKTGAYSVPEGVAAIGAEAFQNCASLSAVTIPDGVTSIGRQAFQGCGALAEITAPDSVTHIGKKALEGTAWLEKQGAFATLNSILVCYRGQEQAVTIPDGVTIIGPNAFAGCSELVSVIIPGSVTSIDEETELVFAYDSGAFGDCEKLTDVTIKNRDARIGKNAFSWLQQKSISTFTVETRDVTVHTPAGGKVEAYCKEHQIKLVSIDESISYPAVEDIPASGTAYTSDLNVNLDGKTVTFSCYALKNEQGYFTNYIRLRDLAAALNGTKAQFNAEWDGWIIKITPNTAFDPKDSGGKVPFSGDQVYISLSDKPISFNGESVKLTSINIQNGNTYYKVADLGKLLNFNVKWAGGVVIETDKPYTGK